MPVLHAELNPHVTVQTVLAYETDTTHYVRSTYEDVEARVRTYFEDIPLMAEVAWCESRFTQIDPRTGTVMRGAMNPADLGVMQINEYYHADTARRLGLDLYSLEGNLAYARYLYEREGTRPWNASRGCWGPTALALR